MSMINVLRFEKPRPATKLTKLMQEGLEITSIRTMSTGPHVGLSFLKHKGRCYRVVWVQTDQ